METKPLLFGLIGFFMGGLLVSLVATTSSENETHSSDSMSGMVSQLEQKSGDDFDRAYLAGMTAHHQSALDMARLAESRAKHQEIKDLSDDIITSQQAEIDQMDDWRTEWGYGESAHDEMAH